MIDLSPQPRTRAEERFVTELPEDTKSAEVEVKVSLFSFPKTELLIERIVKEVEF